MNRNLLLLIYTLYCIACTNSPYEKKNNNNLKINDTMSLQNDIHSIRNYSEPGWDKTRNYYIEVPKLLRRLRNNGYIFPDKNRFRETVLKVFKIDIDTSKTDDIKPENSAFTIFKKDFFIVAFRVYEESDLQNLSRSEDMLFQLNNYIFNNSNEARNILKEKKPSSLTELIFDYGYPILDDSVIADAYFKNANFDTYPDRDWTALLSYEKVDTIIGFKNELGLFLAKNYPNAFESSTFKILHPEPTGQDIYGYSFLNNDVKYKCWGQIVDIGWRIHDISYFVGVFETHKNLSAFYKKHNYYGLKGLERFCQLYDKYGVEDPNKFQPQDEFWNEAPYKVE